MKRIIILIILLFLVGCGDKYKIYKTHKLFNNGPGEYLIKDSKFTIKVSDNKKTLKFKTLGNVNQQCSDKMNRTGNLIFKCKSNLKLRNNRIESYTLSIFMPVASPNDCDQQAYDSCQASDDIENCFCIYLSLPPKPGDEVGTGGNLN